MEVDIVSILGGAVPHEDRPETPGVKRFLNSTTAMAKLNNSSKIDDVDFSEYDVVFMAGGWGAAFDLVCKQCRHTNRCMHKSLYFPLHARPCIQGQSVPLGTRVAAALEAGHPLIASTCHGVLGFVQANKTDGTPWVKGRTMTGVTDAQIHKLGITTQTPLHPETVLRSLGASYQCVHGSNIITGDLGATSTSVPSNVSNQTNHSSICFTSYIDTASLLPRHRTLALLFVRRWTRVVLPLLLARTRTARAWPHSVSYSSCRGDLTNRNDLILTVAYLYHQQNSVFSSV